MDININIDLMSNQTKLRSKKNVMVDGETEEEESRPNVMTDEHYYIDANSEISNKPGKRMIDAQKEQPTMLV